MVPTAEIVAQLLTTIPPAPPARRRGMATWVMNTLDESGVVSIAGWLADVDDLIVSFEEGSAAIIGIIELSSNGAFVAAVHEDSDLFRALAKIRPCDIEFLEARYGVTWQAASDESPAEIRVDDRDATAFLRKLVALVSFCQGVLDYGQGIDVRANMAQQVANHRQSVLLLTEANERLTSVINAALSPRRSA